MRSRYLDLLERTVWTFAQAALAVWIVTDVDLFSAQNAKVAGAAGLVAAVKGVLAFQVGSANTAATLPVGPDTDLGGDAGVTDAGLLIGILLVAVLVLVLYVAGVRV